jgi:hemin uptake protein HemP
VSAAAESNVTDGERQVTSNLLFQGRREVVIVHHGQAYRLRITRADKLILTK